METDKSEVRKKIGIFGGTLDPVHLGHLRAAEEVHEALALDEMWFVPAYLPPHKLEKELTPFEHRLNMVQLAIDGVEHFRASTIEAERKGVSFSVDLLRQINQIYGKSCTFYFVVGTDAALELDSWKDWQQIPKLTNLVIIKRPPVTIKDVRKKFSEIYPGMEMVTGPSPKIPKDGANVILAIETTGIEISSTRIRKKVKQGKSIRFLVPERVRNYIIENNLYVYKKEKTLQKGQDSTSPTRSMEIASKIYNEILDNKGERIVVLDMRGSSPVADFFIIAHGRSTRHVQGIASRMKRELGRQKIKCRSIEGEEEGKWVLMDYDDVVVHLFYEPVRAFYDLEGLWVEAPRLVMTETGLAREEKDNE